MSSNTKIIVLKRRELIYTGIFITVGILLILLIIYMFSPDHKSLVENESEDEDKAIPTITQIIENNVVTDDLTSIDKAAPSDSYQPGVYTSSVSLGNEDAILSVTVTDGMVTNISINELSETTAAMYPLIDDALAAINSELELGKDLNEITASSETEYTSIVILDAAKKALTNY